MQKDPWPDRCGDIIVMGVSGCGKSTVGEALAARLNRRFVEGDALHPDANRSKMAAGTPLTDADRAPWLDRIREEMSRAEAPLVVACSALRRAYRDRLRGKGESAPRPVTFVHLTETRDVIAARIEGRQGHFMPVSLLDSQYATLEPLAPDERGCTVEVSSDPTATVQAVMSALERTVY